MTLFCLSRDIRFPPAWLAGPEGLLCIGGDLSPQRLLTAYQNGIFPWFSRQEPILWWSPDPRLILYPSDVVISRSLKRTIRKNRFRMTADQAFDAVIHQCAAPRKGLSKETWLRSDMIAAYTALHRLGHAHSVEAWLGNELAGGLYGVSIGRVFFGESMFSRTTDASKVALVSLCQRLQAFGFSVIDCQVSSLHLISMGAVAVSRNHFLDMLISDCTASGDDRVWKNWPELPLP